MGWWAQALNFTCNLMASDILMECAPWWKHKRSCRHWANAFVWWKNFWDHQRLYIDRDLALGHHAQLIISMFAAGQGPPALLSSNVRLAPAGSASLGPGVFPVGEPEVSPAERLALDAMLRLSRS